MSTGSLQPGEQEPAPHPHTGLARTALIVGSLVAVVCIAVLIIIFFLDTFNATVYSVGGNSVSDNTQEAQDIRGLYAGARIGSIVLLVAALITAVCGGLLLRRFRKQLVEAPDGGEDVGFDDLAR
ncbi:hypothetical protein PSET11_01801 [Arthrobacter ulcerisalmonis]|uniref:Uncharacterized protein n=1 Tax=Arthrobacter ulcerisalmonis TaxID=2483813 RepID=A0A3P5X9A7_9MICC|nr:hypothetical protein [Arthrobacter ulcerisalmonis]VDC26865.1 hypothetical protein PSET11_01801 [Arthrobacter ulcerisalmonis]